jgi:phosphoribosylaminoimidazolecarboxamide formyltransferase/IMP cyclohydrolase
VWSSRGLCHRCSPELGTQAARPPCARKKLAAKAYARTASYDAAISNWFAKELDDPAPSFRAFGGKLAEALRYGENPHQSAAFYRSPEQRAGVATARQVQGKQLSYNNINDTDAAYECVAEFDP